jgi:hypothetical protein
MPAGVSRSQSFTSQEFKHKIVKTAGQDACDPGTVARPLGCGGRNSGDIIQAMSDGLMTLFTAVIAIATCIYTATTIKLWKATMASVDVSKATVLLNYLATIAQEFEKVKEANPQAAAFLQQIAMLVTEVAMEQFLADINLNKQPRVRDALNKFDGLLRAQNVDPQNIPWFRLIAEKMKSVK